MNEEKETELVRAVLRRVPKAAGVVVQKDGETIFAQGLNGHDIHEPLHLCSVTKSVFSLLIGIAHDSGRLSLEDPLSKFFPEHRSSKTERVTIRDLLTMTAPWHFKVEPYAQYFASPNWCDFALETLGDFRAPPKFHYSPIVGVHILSGVLERAMDSSTAETARTHLFEPLGISVKNVTFTDKASQLSWYGARKESPQWVLDPQGRTTAGWGLCLSALDLAKIGELCLQGGMWHGKRIVSADWIAESTRAHVACPYGEYGYLWWKPRELPTGFAALGDGGNALFVSPPQRLVVAVTAPAPRSPLAAFWGLLMSRFRGSVVDFLREFE